MGWLGKAIGGSLGFMIGGPIGAIAGMALGHQFDSTDSTVHFQTRYSDGEKSQAVFFIATFSLFAKIARADGKVTQEEINVIENVMKNQLGMDSASQEMAIKIFRAAKDSPASFESFAEQFYSLFYHRRDLLTMMIEILLQIAYADGEFHPNEERLIQSAAGLFQIRPHEYDRLRALYIKDHDKYYKILGCERNTSTDDIKKKYRDLAMEYHPDRIIAKGLPEEFTKFATQKFQEIQEAYDKIMTERKAA
jgi:DnaJ like chaperone protein